MINHLTEKLEGDLTDKQITFDFMFSIFHMDFLLLCVCRILHDFLF